MAMDPAGFTETNPMSFNRYAYANDNPYKYIDPDGRESLLFSQFRRDGDISTASFIAVSVAGIAIAASPNAIALAGSTIATPGVQVVAKEVVSEATGVSKAGITKSSRKRVKRLIKKLSDNSRQNDGLSQQKADQLNKIISKAGGQLRNDGASGVKGSSSNKPHMQTEGLGKSIDSRHIWIKNNVQ